MINHDDETEDQNDSSNDSNALFTSKDKNIEDRDPISKGETGSYDGEDTGRPNDGHGAFKIPPKGSLPKGKKPKQINKGTSSDSSPRKQ